MFTCASCNTKHTDGTKCSICKCHYDFQCSGVTEAGYRKLGERKSAWRCPKCKSSPSPSFQASPLQLDLMQEQLDKIMTQLSPLTTLVEDVKSIKSDIASLKNSLEYAHERLENFSSTVQALETKVATAEKLTGEIPVLQAEIARLNSELHERDQWARANNVEIRGIPLLKNENLYEIAQKIGNIGNMNIRKEEINYISRIPTRIPNVEKPIIISFNNRYTKEEFIARSRKSKQLNLSNLGFSKDAAFYVNDHLTLYNKNLLGKARSLAKENNFQFIWVKHCKIMARKSITSPVFFIKKEKDLAKII